MGGGGTGRNGGGCAGCGPDADSVGVGGVGGGVTLSSIAGGNYDNDGLKCNRGPSGSLRVLPDGHCAEPESSKPGSPHSYSENVCVLNSGKMGNTGNCRDGLPFTPESDVHFFRDKWDKWDSSGVVDFIELTDFCCFFGLVKFVNKSRCVGGVLEFRVFREVVVSTRLVGLRISRFWRRLALRPSVAPRQGAAAGPGIRCTPRTPLLHIRVFIDLSTASSPSL